MILESQFGSLCRLLTKYSRRERNAFWPRWGNKRAIYHTFQGSVDIWKKNIHGRSYSGGLACAIMYRLCDDGLQRISSIHSGIHWNGTAKRLLKRHLAELGESSSYPRWWEATAWATHPDAPVTVEHTAVSQEQKTPRSAAASWSGSA